MHVESGDLTDRVGGLPRALKVGGVQGKRVSVGDHLGSEARLFMPLFGQGRVELALHAHGRIVMRLPMAKQD